MTQAEVQSRQSRNVEVRAYHLAEAQQLPGTCQTCIDSLHALACWLFHELELLLLALLDCPAVTPHTRLPNPINKHINISVVPAVELCMMLPVLVLQIIEAPPSLKRHKSSSSRGPSKPQVQVIPARQRVLSKLGLLHSSSLKQLVQIRPSKLPGQHGATANNSQPRHHNVRGTDSRQQAVSPHQPVVKRHACLPHTTTATKLSSIQTRPITQQSSYHGRRGNETFMVDRGNSISRQQHSKAPAPVLMLKEECTPSGHLVEDDIDWGAGGAAQARDAEPSPVAEQPWTVQYLEGHDEVDAARDQMLGRNVSSTHSLKQKSQLSVTSSTSRDKAPVKHGTGVAGWIEDDIQWD